MAPHPPPELTDDAIGEILLRLPPDEPACLLHASLVCKHWRSLVSNHAFLREYRAFHRAPPVLGFFHDKRRKSGIFVPTATMPTLQPAPQPPAAAAASARTSYQHTLDCRHGRVLFDTKFNGAASSTLTVWDPLTGDHKHLSPPMDLEPNYEFAGAVLCASTFDGCNHLECSGGPFQVVIAGVRHHNRDHDYYDGGDGVAWARVYSSETGVWGAPTATIDVNTFFDRTVPWNMLVGGAIYFMLGFGEKFLKFDMVGSALSVMKAPPQPEDDDGESNLIIFAAAQDGELGAATLERYSLHLWSWRADPTAAAVDGGGEWERVRVIELDMMIQFSIGDPTTDFELAGFAQGAGLIFISLNYDDMFTVDLKSGHIRKTCNKGYYGNIFPLVSFCTPDRVSTGLQVPMVIE